MIFYSISSNRNIHFIFLELFTFSKNMWNIVSLTSAYKNFVARLSNNIYSNETRYTYVKLKYEPILKRYIFI